MKKLLSFAIFLSLLLSLPGCKRQTMRGLNVEQANHPVAARILSPGMGTVGIIEGEKVYVYYLTEKHEWMLDKLSQFNIPPNNSGLLSLGMGTIGVFIDKEILVYRLDNHNNWVSDPRFTFTLPSRYDRIKAAKMPWEMAMIMVETNGIVDFYYFDQNNNSWSYDETAAFVIPLGITQYFSLGDMTIAVSDGEKLGVYYLHPEGRWEFVEDLVLQLSDNFDVLMPWESGFIAMLIENRLEFLKLDLEHQQWLHLEEMVFFLPSV